MYPLRRTMGYVRRPIAALMTLVLFLTAAIPGASSQAATPEATPSSGSGTLVEFLFVQAAESGTFRPTDEPGIFELELRHAGGTTLAFSDRPAREVHTLATTAFLDTIGFTPDPPNAVLATGPDDGDVALVLVLLGGSYDTGTGTLTYRVSILAEIDDRTVLDDTLPEGATVTPPAEFGASSLFIDSDWDPSQSGRGGGHF